jgi:hypothetical protein
MAQPALAMLAVLRGCEMEAADVCTASATMAGMGRAEPVMAAHCCGYSTTLEESTTLQKTRDTETESIPRGSSRGLV